MFFYPHLDKCHRYHKYSPFPSEILLPESLSFISLKRIHFLHLFFLPVFHCVIRLIGLVGSIDLQANIVFQAKIIGRNYRLGARILARRWKDRNFSLVVGRILTVHKLVSEANTLNSEGARPHARAWKWCLFFGSILFEVTGAFGMTSPGGICLEFTFSLGPKWAIEWKRLKKSLLINDDNCLQDMRNVINTLHLFNV